MGNLLAKHEGIISAMDEISDARYTVKYMEDGECGRQFLRATHKCHPGRIQWRRDHGHAAGISAGEGARVTEALLKCMKRRPQHFSAYIRRIEDQDQDRRPEKVPPAPW
jgi:hypothetical protein